MADKSFGVKELNIIGTGTPTIQSPNSGDLNITAATSTFSGHIALGDSKVLKLGAAPDMSIFHDGTSGSINLANGSLTTRVHDAVGKGFYIEDPNGGSAETIAKFEKDATSGKGRCELMYEGLKKFETTSSGVTITGDLTVSGTYPGSGSGGVTVQDEGSSLSTTGTTLNFVGDGVVASGTGATKTITISGGGGGSPTTVLVAESSDDNVAYNIPFLTASGAGGGQRGLQVDNGGLGFNAGTNTLFIQNISLQGGGDITLTKGGTSVPLHVGVSSEAFSTAYTSANTDLQPHSNVAIGLSVGQKLGFSHDSYNQYSSWRTEGNYGRNYGTYSIRTDRGASTNAVYGSGAGASFKMANYSGEVLLATNVGNFNIGGQSGGTDYNGFLFKLDGTMENCCSSSAGENIRIQRRSDGNAIEFGDTETNTIGSISLNTSANTTAYNETSDYRIKENVVGITSALDKVNQLRPVNFNFIGKSVKLDGFLAHEVQAVIPYAVTGEKDAVKTVKDGDLSDDGTKESADTLAALSTKEIPALQQLDKTKLIALLTASVQELSAKNDALEARIKTLEGS